MRDIEFQTIDWEKISSPEHPGETGVAFWKTLQFSGLRIRIVDYSPGYLADHWCKKDISFIALKENSKVN